MFDSKSVIKIIDFGVGYDPNKTFLK